MTDGTIDFVLRIDSDTDIDNNPELIFIGDFIDKGESSKRVLDYLLDLNDKYKCIFIEGNHEYQWLKLSKENNIEEYLFKYGGGLTMDSFDGINNLYEIKKLFLNSYKSLFSSLVPYWENDKYVITHSGIPPELYNRELNDIEKSNFLTLKNFFL